MLTMFFWCSECCRIGWQDAGRAHGNVNAFGGRAKIPGVRKLGGFGAYLPGGVENCGLKCCTVLGGGEGDVRILSAGREGNGGEGE